MISCDFLSFLPAKEEEEVSVVKRDIPSHPATRVRRQTLALGASNRVQGLTAKQDCDGILLQWDSLNFPFRYQAWQ